MYYILMWDHIYTIGVRNREKAAIRKIRKIKN